MNLIHAASELQAGGRKVCAAIGVFDGVHLGHQQVIRQTLADAEQQEGVAVVITFDQHPNTVVAPTRVPPLIYSLPQKLRTIAALGVDTVWLIHFDEAFSRQTGEAFVRALVRDFGHLDSIRVGREFTFGHKRNGNVALLQTLGQELKFVVHGLAAVSLDGQPVSSTRIREAIRTGHLDAASQMLGRAYALAGLVVRGDQMGRQLGFPTANLDVHSLVLPPQGVYAAHLRANGESFRGVLNIGYRPTLQSTAPQLRVEAHLLDFKGDLYGQELEVTFVKKLREEQTFPSLELLRQQIARDVVQARALFVAS
jgi:riboflavin kinase/FMN adenylyltransferase